MSDLNYISPNRFDFSVEKLQRTSFHIKSITLPGFSIPPVEQGSPLQKVKRQGDTIAFDELTVTFNVTEDMGNYIDVLNWMFGIGFPDTTDQYANLVRNESLYSDGSLMIHSNQSNPTAMFKFKDMFPTSISSLDFTVENEETYLLCTVTFAYTGVEYDRNV